MPAAPLHEAEAPFRRWLAAELHGEMRFMQDGERVDPLRLLPEAKSLLVVAAPYSRPWSATNGGDPAPSRPEHPAKDGEAAPLKHAVASYALGRDYHHVLRAKLLELGQWLSDALGRELIGRPCVDSAPLLERAAAARAGVGFIGKSSLCIVPGAGSFVLLGELLLDVELPASDAPVPNGCGRCTACLDVCPTRAFPEPYVLDARRCISYLTIELRGSIPRELRAPIGRRVFGCDLCQEACPYNHSPKPVPIPEELAPRTELDALSLTRLLDLRSGDYRRLVKGSALGRASRTQLQRNAAVALGNLGGESAVAALGRALASNPSPIVREHAAWALGHIGGEASAKHLETALGSETDGAVLSELRLALAELREGATSAQGPRRGNLVG